MSSKLRHQLSQRELDYLYYLRRNFRRKQKGVSIEKQHNRRPTHAKATKHTYSKNRG